MENIVKARLEEIKLGEIQLYNHVAVIPIISTNGSGLNYLTMKEAMESHSIIVTELTEDGTVPELKVVNKAEKPVLLLDGEELAGAKQNRVLNTTILLKENSETIIPVSCTEQGRWCSRSEHFEESGYMMSSKLRGIKNRSVYENLKLSRKFVSDQGEVWNRIASQACENKVNVPTGAMRDVLEAKKEDLDSYLENFPLVADQKGLLVIVSEDVVGLDILSRKEAFRVLHPKLIKSYVMDALTMNPKKGNYNYREKTDNFLKKIQGCNENVFESVGYGRDFRYEGNKIVGSALVHADEIVHMAFFRVTEAEKSGHMSSVSRRRAYRTN